MAYTINGFRIDDNQLFADIIVDNTLHNIGLRFGSKEHLITIMKGYLQVNINHIIDSTGVCINQLRGLRPFAPLQEGQRQCKQWEFDKFCYENPDPRYKIDINAIVWKTFNEKFCDL